MRPGVRRLESQPFCEAAIYPNLKPVICRIPGRLAHQDWAEPLESAIRGDQAVCRLTFANGPSNRRSRVRNNVIEIHAAPPDVQAVVSYVRGFHNRVLEDFARKGQVPLPALRRTEVFADGVESRVSADTGNRILQTRIDRIQAAI